jgi:hypothetical protein
MFEAQSWGLPDLLSLFIWRKFLMQNLINFQKAFGWMKALPAP